MGARGRTPLERERERRLLRLLLLFFLFFFFFSAGRSSTRPISSTSGEADLDRDPERERLRLPLRLRLRLRLRRRDEPDVAPPNLASAPKPTGTDGASKGLPSSSTRPVRSTWLISSCPSAAIFRRRSAMNASMAL